MAIENRMEIMFYTECKNGNPNGDPDLGNLPRFDEQDNHGIISDGAIKRHIRNYVQAAYGDIEGMDMLVRSQSNINTGVARAKEAAGVALSDATSPAVNVSKAMACKMFFDVRAFGAVMSTGPNAGQVRGPVQFEFGRSLDPIRPIDMAISRMAASNKIDGAKSSADYVNWENSVDEGTKQTIGRKQYIPYGLYENRRFISANLAKQTGFSERDLKILFEAILNMYEHDRSASKGEMSVIPPLIIFKHVGTDSDETQRKHQALLGCAPAYSLFDLVKVTKKPDVKYPRSYKDYTATIALDKKPNGVDIGFLTSPYGEIVWNQIPANSDLFGIA